MSARELSIQKTKAKQFYDLHHSGKLLILPNIWDSLGAQLLQHLGYPAVATASASIAYTNAYNDGENIPFDELLILLKKIASSVDVPVTADVESGFAQEDDHLRDNIRRLLETGIVGINIEDSDKRTKALLPPDRHCEKIRIIKEVAEESGVPLFINARTDVYIQRKKDDGAELILQETLRRGRAYKEAGADCFYPITMNKIDDIRITVEQLQMPVNVLAMAGLPDLEVLEKMGVARVSLGPGFLKASLQSMKNLAEKLKRHEGLDDIVNNEITSDFLQILVSGTK